MNINLDVSHLSSVLANQKIKKFVERSLNSNLLRIGFSDVFCKDLKNALDTFEITSFRRKHKKELESVYENRYYRNMVPQYFRKYIFPEVNNAQNILDFGCGSGGLSYNLSKERLTSTITGIDIVKADSWDRYSSKLLRYHVFKPDKLADIIEEISPDVFICTWVLHHLTIEQQDSLFTILSKVKSKPQLVILEDSYSVKLKPLCWPEVMHEFDRFTYEEKKKTIYAFDCIVNIMFSGRYEINMPNTYKTVEGWSDFIENYNFKIKMVRYIGVPKYRDTSSPQALMIFE